MFKLSTQNKSAARRTGVFFVCGYAYAYLMIKAAEMLALNHGKPSILEVLLIAFSVSLFPATVALLKRRTDSR